MEKISKDIVNIIGCRRPQARIERGWETVFLSVANDIVTIIGCSRPKRGLGRGGTRRGGRNQSQASSPPPPLQLSYFLVLELSTYHRSIETHYK
jgi:hypothetical protein